MNVRERIKEKLVSPPKEKKLGFKLKKKETSKKKRGSLLITMSDGSFSYETISETGRHCDDEIKSSDIDFEITQHTKIKDLHAHEEKIRKILQDRGDFPKPVNDDEDEQELNAEDLQRFAAEKELQNLLDAEKQRKLALEEKQKQDRKPVKALPRLPAKSNPAHTATTNDCPIPNDAPAPLEPDYVLDHSLSDLPPRNPYEDDAENASSEESSHDTIELPPPITADNLPEKSVNSILISPRTQELINKLPAAIHGYSSPVTNEEDESEEVIILQEEIIEEVTALEESASSADDNDTINYAKAMLTTVVDMYLIANKTSNLGLMGLFSPHGRNGRKSARKFKELFDANTTEDTSIEALQETLTTLIAHNQGLLSGAYRKDSFNTHLLAYNDMLSKLQTGELKKNIDVRLYVQDFAQRTPHIKDQYREIFISREMRR